MTTENLKKAQEYRWLIFAILALSYVLVYFHRLCPAVLAVDMINDLSTTGARFGFMASAYFYPYAVMQLPAGLLSDSWGPRKTITLFFVIAFIGAIILGQANSLTMALIGRGLTGLGVSMLFVPTMKVLAEWFRAREFAGMTGIFMAMGGVGSYSAQTPLAHLSNAVGWRTSFLIVGAFTLVLAALVWIVVRDKPGDMGWPSPAEAEREADAPAIGIWEGVKTVLKNPRFWPLAIWFFFEIAVFFSIAGLWGGPYLMNVYGLTKTQTGNILAMLALGLVAGSPLLGFLSNRVFKGRKNLLVISSLISVILIGSLYLYPDGFSTLQLYVAFLGIGIFTNAVVVLGFTATKELFPVEIAGTSTGLVNLFPFLGGALAMPVLGYFLERHGKIGDAFTLEGYRETFLALLVCSVIAFMASLFVKETFHGKTPDD